MSTLSGWDHTLGSMVYSSLAGNPSQAELPTALLGQKGSPAELCTSESLLGPTACRSLVHPELSTRCPLCLYLIPMARLCRFSQRSPGGETQVGLLGSSDTRVCPPWALSSPWKNHSLPGREAVWSLATPLNPLCDLGGPAASPPAPGFPQCCLVYGQLPGSLPVKALNLGTTHVAILMASQVVFKYIISGNLRDKQGL